MRAARVHEYGPPTNVVVEEVADPRPGPGEVVVDMAAAALNFPDVLFVADRYQISVPLPFTPGSEFAGTVRSVGPGVEDVRVGDRVAGMAAVGAFAEQVLAPAAGLLALPDDLDFASAAAVNVTYRTSYHALRSVAEAREGEWVVVLGAAGGVGSAAVDVARRLGCRVVACAAGPERTALCAGRGADAVVDYAAEDLKTRIKELTGGGADIVIDPVGGGHAEASLRALAWGGRFVTIGYASGAIPAIPLNLVLLKGVVIKGFEMRTFAQHRPEEARRDDREFVALLADGLRPYISAVFPLDDVVNAMASVAGRRATGKVVVVP